MFKWKNIPWSARFGLFGIAAFLLFAFVGPWVWPHSAEEIVGEKWDPVFGDFILGTDQIGRDLVSRLMAGARITILIATAASLLSFTMGAILGFTAAVLRGWADLVMSRFNDLLMSIPTLIFALVVLAVLPRSTLVMILVMAVLDATRVFRLSRAVAVDISVQDFVEAARLRGEKTDWVVFREILPNALTTLVAEFGLRFAFAVLFLSSLSFLGLGIQPPDADLGRMVADNKEGIVYGIPAALIPGGFIAFMTVSVNMTADWIITHTSSLKGGRGGG